MIKKIVDFFTRKDKLIRKQQLMIENRDKFIDYEMQVIENLESLVKSLKEEVESLRIEAYKNVKTRKKSATSLKN